MLLPGGVAGGADRLARHGDARRRGQLPVAGEWENWKATVPYHGEIGINPDTGAVMRLVVQADLKGSDPVRVENQRIDYGPENAGDRSPVVPVQVLIDTSSGRTRTRRRGDSLCGTRY